MSEETKLLPKGHKHIFKEYKRFRLPDKIAKNRKTAAIWIKITEKCILCKGDMIAFRERDELQGHIPLTPRGLYVH